MKQVKTIFIVDDDPMQASMLQDYLKGRPMEIEAQLMAPLALARAANVATPTLDIVLPLAAHKAMAKGLYRPSARPAFA